MTTTAPTDVASIVKQLQDALATYNSGAHGGNDQQVSILQQQIATLLQHWYTTDATSFQQAFGGDPTQMQSLISAMSSGDATNLDNLIPSVLPDLTSTMSQYTATATATPSETLNPGGGSGAFFTNEANNQASGQPTTASTTPKNGVSGTGDQQVLTETVDGVTSTLSFNTAQDIINSALQTVGLDPASLATSGINSGETLGNFFWSQIVNQGITDPSTIGSMISVLLPSTGQFQVAFPGYQAALKSGYVRTVAEYVQSEEGITAVMLQGGVPKDMINPTTVGDLISNGVSVNEVAQRVQNGLDAALNAPAEVQSYFEQEFGAGNGPAALATVFLNPDINDVTLQKMFAGSEIRGAAAAQNLTISQGLSQRLADMGQNYASAQQKFQTLAQQQGLFEQTVGEASSQKPVPGSMNADKPLSESDQGVEAAFGLSGTAMQQVHQAALARINEFRGGGGGSTTQAEGFDGLAAAKPY